MMEHVRQGAIEFLGEVAGGRMDQVVWLRGW